MQRAFIVPKLAPEKYIKARIGENQAGKVTIIVPDTTYNEHYIEIVTQYSGGSQFLKEPRVITSDFTIEAV